MAGLYGFFGLTLFGKALHATAVNRLGARLVGISTGLSGRVAFALAGLVGAFGGVLIAPLTTVYYDSGFLVGLKGFVAAIVGGMVSYPLAAAGGGAGGGGGELLHVLGQRVQGGDRVHRDPPRAAGPLAAQPGRGGRGVRPPRAAWSRPAAACWPGCACALLPGVPAVLADPGRRCRDRRDRGDRHRGADGHGRHHLVRAGDVHGVRRLRHGAAHDAGRAGRPGCRCRRRCWRAGWRRW